MSVAVLLAVLLQAQPAPTPAPATDLDGVEPEYVTRPEWRQLPTSEDMARHYPRQAGRAGGTAIVDCFIDDRGHLNACVVVAESPAGSGFGEATIHVAGQFRSAPRDKAGAPVEGRRVRIPMRWRRF